MSKVDDLIQQAADLCEAAGVEVDGEHGGAVHQWVESNCSFKPGQSFFIVFLLTAELADRRARREGFTDQCDRAAKLAFAKFPPKGVK